jgi:RecA-family ATPase
MRLPGTTNSKDGDSIPVRALADRPDARYGLAELEAWLEAAEPVIHRKGAEGNGSSTDNPFTAYAKLLGVGAPLDVDRLLAEMIWNGTGGGGNAHHTLLRCTAAMLTRGEDVETVVARTLEALRQAAERSGTAENPASKEGDVRKMCADWMKKHPEILERDSDETEEFQPLATVYTFPNPAEIPPREFLFGRHYVRGFATTTVAPGGTGKSSRSLAEAIAMVTNKSFLGDAPRNGPLRVWYYGEDPKDELDRRIAAILQHYGLRPDEAEGRLCVDSIHSFRLKELAIHEPAKSGAKVIFDERLVRDLVETFHARKLDVAIFDPLVTLHSVPENDPAAMDAVVRKFGVIAEQVRAAIDLVHHTRKPAGGQTEMTVEDARGARAIIDAGRASRIFNRMSPKEAEAAGIELDERWRYFRSDTGKANMAPPDVAAWSELISVIIANSDNVGVVVPWSYPSALDEVTPEDVRWIRELVRAEPDHAYDSRAKDWVGIPLAERLDLDPEDKADRAKLKKILRTWRANGVIEIVERTAPDTRHKRSFVKPGKRGDESNGEA